MTYPILEEKDYLKLTEAAKLVKRTRTKIRLLLSPDGKIIKHIYRRRLLSTSTLWPYAARFINNAKKLESLNISVPKINDVYYYPKLNCDIIVYDYVKGPTLNEIASTNDFSFFPLLIQYIAQLHQNGIYFKDLHLSNIVYHDGLFTLIDLETIHCKKRSLRISERAKNLAYLFNIKEHIQFYLHYGTEKFTNEYLSFTPLTERSKKRIKQFLISKLPKELSLSTI